jgi:hypothetical protein
VRPAHLAEHPRRVVLLLGKPARSNEM